MNKTRLTTVSRSSLPTTIYSLIPPYLLVARGDDGSWAGTAGNILLGIVQTAYNKTSIELSSISNDEVSTIAYTFANGGEGFPIVLTFTYSFE
jgi:hypothetical protein